MKARRDDGIACGLTPLTISSLLPTFTLYTFQVFFLYITEKDLYFELLLLTSQKRIHKILKSALKHLFRVGGFEPSTGGLSLGLDSSCEDSVKRIFEQLD